MARELMAPQPLEQLGFTAAVGQCKLNPVDPSRLKAPGFNLEPIK
jgi:hypothetical protein